MAINWEEISFGIITYAGTAKSDAIMSIQQAKEGNFDVAKEMLKEADESIVEAEKLHIEVIQQEAQGVQHDFKVLFMHAEDQMLTAQMVMELAKEFVDLYKKLKDKKVID